MKNFFATRFLLGLFGLFLSKFSYAIAISDLAGKTVAVTDVSQRPIYARYGKALRSQFESILQDNGVKVLDLEKVEALRNNWDKLDDPSSFITAEDFLERSQRYSIDAVVSLYYNVDVKEFISGYYSATAVVVARMVSEEGDVKSEVSIPMGTLGYTPSDGLTEGAAIVNALRREADRAATEWGLDVFVPQNPVFFELELKQVTTLPSQLQRIDRVDSSEAITELKSLYEKSKGGKKSKVTCESASASVAALGIYTSDTDLQRNRRSYGSSLVIADVEGNKKLNAFVFHEMMEGRKRFGSAKIQQCQFFNGWRFLIGASSRGIKIYDMEKGREVVFAEFHDKPKKVLFEIMSSGDANYLRVNVGAEDIFYEILRAS